MPAFQRTSQGCRDAGCASVTALLEAGLTLTLNSDDPAYFGGGMLDNFLACQRAFGWSQQTFVELSRNAIAAAFMSEERRDMLLTRLAAETS